MERWVIYRGNTRRADFHDDAVNKLQGEKTSIQPAHVKLILHFLTNLLTFILKRLSQKEK